MAIIISRLMKENDVEITDMVEGVDFSEKEEIKHMIID